MSIFNNILIESVVTCLYEPNSDYELIISPFVYMYEFDGLSKALSAFSLNLALQKRINNDGDNMVVTDLILDIQDVSKQIDNIVRVVYNNSYADYIESVQDKLVDPYIIDMHKIDNEAYNNVLSSMNLMSSYLFTEINKGMKSRGIDTKQIQDTINIYLEAALGLETRSFENLSEQVNTKLSSLNSDMDLFRYINMNDSMIDTMRTNVSLLNSISDQLKAIPTELMQSFNVDGDRIFLKSYYFNTGLLSYYTIASDTNVLCEISDIHEFTELLKYLTKVIGAFEQLSRFVDNLKYDYTSRLASSQISFRRALVGINPPNMAISYIKEKTDKMLVDHIDDIEDDARSISESVQFMKNYDPFGLLSKDFRIIQEAARDAKDITSNIESMKKKVRAFKKQFNETSKELVSTNSEWLTSVSDFNTRRIDGDKFEYKMYPYWKTIDDMVSYKIPPFNESDLTEYADIPAFRTKYFGDLLDADGKPLYHEKFRGGMKEDIRNTKINATFNKCMRIIKRYSNYSNKINTDINALLSNLNTASRKILSESTSIDSLIESNVLEDRMFQALLEAASISPKLANSESNVDKTTNIDSMGGLVVWFKECYKVVSAKMVVLEEAYDASIKYIQYLQRADTLSDRTEDNKE